jgi:uncharacterized protein with ATP-grasp and redox domains
LLRQALEATRFAGANERTQEIVLGRVMEMLEPTGPSCTPAEIAYRIHRFVRQEVGHRDPYQVAKQNSTQRALALYPRLKSLLAKANDPLETAVRLSIAGNIMDFALDRRYELWKEVEQVLEQRFAIDDGAAFREALRGAGHVLFLADNAGETVFDRVLIEFLDVAVVYAVKGGAILNDATWSDARAAGVDGAAEIVSTGSDAPGTILSRCSDEFRRRYDDAELVIVKGQANYETLSDEGPKVFFALRVKCPVIADDVGAPVGSIVFKQGGAR